MINKLDKQFSGADGDFKSFVYKSISIRNLFP